MADVKISAATDAGTLAATDKVPLARDKSSTAYAATIAEIATYTASTLPAAPVTKVAGRTGDVTLTHADLTDWSTATSTFTYTLPIAGASVLGGVKVGTGLTIDGSGVLAASGTSGVSTFNTRTGAVTLASKDVTDALTFTPYNATNPSNYIAAAGAPVQSVAGKTGTVTLDHADLTDWATATSGFTYTLPTASTTTLGGVKVDGTTITIASGVISSAGGGASVTVQATAPSSPSTGDLWWSTTDGNLYVYDGAWALASPGVGYTLPAATSSVLGGVKPDGTTIANTAGAISVAYGTSSTTAARGDDSRITGALSAATAASTYLAQTALADVGRNLLHNGLFRVAQRGAGPWTANGNYTLDRWQLSLSLDSASISQVAHSDASRAQVGDESAAVALANAFTGNAGAGAYNRAVQRIEDVRRLAGKTVTVSLWAAAASGTPKLGIGIVQSFGTGGSPSGAVVVAGQSVTLSTTYTRYSATFSIPSISGKTLGSNNDHNTELSLWFSSGTTNATAAGSVGVQSATIAIWGVQLEVGSVATPLEKPDVRYDLANCQRFAVIQSFAGGSYGAAGSGAYVTVPLPVTMRVQPTNTLSGLSYGNASAAGLFSSGVTHTVLSLTATATGALWVAGTLTATADL